MSESNIEKLNIADYVGHDDDDDDDDDEDDDDDAKGRHPLKKVAYFRALPKGGGAIGLVHFC